MKHWMRTVSYSKEKRIFKISLVCRGLFRKLIIFIIYNSGVTWSQFWGGGQAVVKLKVR